MFGMLLMLTFHITLVVSKAQRAYAAYEITCQQTDKLFVAFVTKSACLNAWQLSEFKAALFLFRSGAVREAGYGWAAELLQ